MQGHPPSILLLRRHLTTIDDKNLKKAKPVKDKDRKKSNHQNILAHQTSNNI